MGLRLRGIEELDPRRVRLEPVRAAGVQAALSNRVGRDLPHNPAVAPPGGMEVARLLDSADASSTGARGTAGGDLRDGVLGGVHPAALGRRRHLDVFQRTGTSARSSGFAAPRHLNDDRQSDADFGQNREGDGAVGVLAEQGRPRLDPCAMDRNGRSSERVAAPDFVWQPLALGFTLALLPRVAGRPHDHPTVGEERSQRVSPRGCPLG